MMTSGSPGRRLDRAAIERVVQAAADRLPGDWVLVGGGLAALWFDPERVTEDIDLVSLAGSAGERLALLDLAVDLGLPVEALNSAADYFVRRVDGWRAELEGFRTGAKARILRPTPTLFLLLKVQRLSEEDLRDCLGMLERARADGLPVDAARVQAAINSLPAGIDEEVGIRRGRLRAALLASR